MTRPVDEADLPGYFLPNRWTWVLVFGFAALLTEWWLLTILTLVAFGIALWDDYAESDIDGNFGFDREAINEAR